MFSHIFFGREEVVLVGFILFFLLLSLLFYKKLSFIKIILYSATFLYTYFLVVVLIFPLPDFSILSREYPAPINLIPFIGFYEIFSRGIEVYEIRQIVYNIVLLFPLGVFLPLIFQKLSKKKQIFIGLAFAFFAEFIQLLSGIIIGYNYKYAETDDVILNFLGFLIGYFLCSLIQKICIKKK